MNILMMDLAYCELLFALFFRLIERTECYWRLSQKSSDFGVNKEDKFHFIYPNILKFCICTKQNPLVNRLFFLLQNKNKMI